MARVIDRDELARLSTGLEAEHKRHKKEKTRDNFRRIALTILIGLPIGAAWGVLVTLLAGWINGE